MRNHDLSTGINLTAAKVSQCRLVDDITIEREEAKKETAKKIAIQNLHIQQKRSEDFHKYQEYMYSLLLSTSEEYMFIEFVNLSSNTLKESFSHLGGKLGDLQNHKSLTVSREIIWHLNV